MNLSAEGEFKLVADLLTNLKSTYLVSMALVILQIKKTYNLTSLWKNTTKASTWSLLCWS
jgi:hypothetical protein